VDEHVADTVRVRPASEVARERREDDVAAVGRHVREGRRVVRRCAAGIYTNARGRTVFAVANVYVLRRVVARDYVDRAAGEDDEAAVGRYPRPPLAGGEDNALELPAEPVEAHALGGAQYSVAQEAVGFAVGVTADQIG
jgi:hypothetical protein